MLPTWVGELLAVEKTVWLLPTESVGTTEFSDRGITNIPPVEK
jgi:hypothetical protein